MPTFVAFNPLFRGPTPMERNNTKAIAIIEGCSFASIGGFLII